MQLKQNILMKLLVSSPMLFDSKPCHALWKYACGYHPSPNRLSACFVSALPPSNVVFTSTSRPLSKIARRTCSLDPHGSIPFATNPKIHRPRINFMSTQLFSSSSHKNDSNALTKTYILHFDSQVDAKTKDTAIGITIYDYNGSRVWSGHHLLSKDVDTSSITRNVADYMALWDGLQIAHHLLLSHSSLSSSSKQEVKTKLEIQSTNELIVKQINGKNRVSSSNLKPWYEKVTSLIKEFDHAKTGKIDKDMNKFTTKNAKLALEKRMSTEKYTEVMKLLSQPAEDRAVKMQRNGGLGGVEQNIISSMPEETAVYAVKPPTQSMMQQFNPMDQVPRDEFSQQHISQISKPKPENDESEHGKIHPDKTYILRFDGGSRGNPGNAGSGMVLYDSEDGSELWCGHFFLGQATNNEAEYMGMITGLQCAKSLGVRHIVVQGDSQLVLRQVDGTYKVKSPTLKSYYDEAIGLKREFVSFQTCHIAREENKRADELANIAMDTKGSDGFNVAND